MSETLASSLTTVLTIVSILLIVSVLIGTDIYVKLRKERIAHSRESSDLTKEIARLRTTESLLKGSVDSLTREIRGAATSAETDKRKAVDLAKKQALDGQRSHYLGKFAETFAPFLENFPLAPHECMHFGRVCDYIGICTHGGVDVVRFVEIKTGSGYLDPTQQRFKSAIDAGHVEWHTFVVDVRKFSD